MNIQIDQEAGTCVLEFDQQTHTFSLERVRVTTDPRARTSVVEVDGRQAPLSEPDAEMLIAAGAEDGRFNLIVDD